MAQSKKVIKYIETSGAYNRIAWVMYEDGSAVMRILHYGHYTSGWQVVEETPMQYEGSPDGFEKDMRTKVRDSWHGIHAKTPPPYRWGEEDSDEEPGRPIEYPEAVSA